MPRRPRFSARAAGVALVALVIVLLGGGQLVLPRLAEHKVEQRLTAGGGSADVDLSAVPAVRLLFGHGDRIRVRGRDMRFDLTDRRSDALKRLDRFGEVDVRLRDLTAGPFLVPSFALERDGSRPYSLRMHASFSPAGLAGLGVGRLGGGGVLGGLLGTVVGQAVPGAGGVPIDLDLRLRSDGGRIVVTGGRATVAGYPFGFLAPLITAAIVVRI